MSVSLAELEMRTDNVSDEMLLAACRVFFGEDWSFIEAETMRLAIAAAMEADCQ
jgi:hypothetical protein